MFADDLEVGDVYELGSHLITREAVVEFATDWDPQFFHVDAAAAERGVFDSLIASGW